MRTDGRIVSDLGLLRRAQLVVDMGDTFDNGTTPASLAAEPVVSALTLMRACDRIIALGLNSTSPAPARPTSRDLDESR